jgi:hypothetical protein
MIGQVASGPLGVVLLLLGACATPSVPMLSATRSDIDVRGVSFTVHHDRTRAEVVRTTPLAEPGLRPMLAMSVIAMETASGCPIRPGTLYGDRVMAEAFLDCPDNPGVTLRPRWVFTPPR